MTKKTKKNDATRFKGLTKASIIAISVDILLISLKYLLANITGNPVLLADVLHSTGDLAITLSVMISIFINYKFPNNSVARHAEGIAALFISFFLILGSTNLIWGVISQESASYLLNNDIKLVVAIAGISVAMAIAFYMSRYKKMIGEKFNSFAFKAESTHTYSDFLTSFGVWATLIFGYFGVHFEKVTTVLVGLVVIKIGFSLLFQSLTFFDLKEIVKFIEKISNLLKDKVISFYRKIEFALLKETKDEVGKVFHYIEDEWIVKNKWKLLRWNLIFIVLLYFGTGFYFVLPSQSGLNFILGRNVGKVESGMHYNLPTPVGSITIVDTESILRVESGFRLNENFKGKEPDIYLWELSHSIGKITKVPTESISLTGDENIVDANFLCYYKVSDPSLYSLKTENAKEVLRNIFTYEIHAVLAHNFLEEILTSARGKVQKEIKENLIAALQKIEIGVEIINVYLLEAHPPIEVVPKYRAVASAREKKDEIIFKSETYVNDLLPKSRGESESLIIRAEAYSVEKMNLAKGETQNYNLRQRYFSYGVDINKTRMWWENVENVLKGKSIYILPKDIKKRFYSSDGKSKKKSSNPEGFDK